MVPLRVLRPRFAHEVETVVAPVYARRDELTSAVADIRRVLTDQLDGDNEATAVLGRVLADVKTIVEAMDADLTAVRAQLDRLEASVRSGPGAENAQGATGSG